MLPMSMHVSHIIILSLYLHILKRDTHLCHIIVQTYNFHQSCTCMKQNDTYVKHNCAFTLSMHKFINGVHASGKVTHIIKKNKKEVDR